MARISIDHLDRVLILVFDEKSVINVTKIRLFQTRHVRETPPT
jgi:hypothetical protein